MNDYYDNSNTTFAERTTSLNYNQDFQCEKCGTRLSDIRRDGIIGCANCYKIFENEIRELIFRNQGTVNHIGQIPSKHFSKVKLREKIIELEREKESAIQIEDFIAAESIKNQIEKLKGEL